MQAGAVIDLDEARIVREINELHGTVESAARTRIENAIRIGELLTVIKGSLKHGEWLPWVRANCTFHHTRANEYMRAYEGRTKLSDSLSLPEARTIAGLAKKAKSQRKPRSSVGWTEAVEHHLGAMPEGYSRNTLAQTPEKKAGIEAELGAPIPSRVVLDSEQARAIARAVQACADRRQPIAARAAINAEAASLPEASQAKLARLEQRTVKVLQGEFDEAVRRAVEERLGTERQLVLDKAKELQASIEEWKDKAKTLDQWMTRDEYKLVLGCLHPDRQPESEHERYARAFHIFKRLEARLDRDGRTLRARGW